MTGMPNFAIFIHFGCGSSLSLDILNNANLYGLTIFNKEIYISQLADDTTLFLRDKDQVAHVLNALTAFSIASGLKLNVSKCEIFCLFDSDDKEIENMLCVKYLGINLSKTHLNMNFSSKMKYI